MFIVARVNTLTCIVPRSSNSYPPTFSTAILNCSLVWILYSVTKIRLLYQLAQLVFLSCIPELLVSSISEQLLELEEPSHWNLHEKKKRFWPAAFDLWPMTLTFKLYPDIPPPTWPPCQRVIVLFPGYPPSPYRSPYWICTQHSTCQWSRTSICFHSMWLPHTKGHTSNPWNKCPRRVLMTTGVQIPIEKHYHYFRSVCLSVLL